MENLAAIAKQCRQKVLEMAYAAKDSHIGCALSSVDVLVLLFFRVMNVNPEDPRFSERDRFILSKGHAAAALYAVMSARGFFPREALATFAQNGSELASHVERKLPGVETNGGSGGHGLSIGAGMALAAQADGANYRIFILMGDGELQEGSVWEAAMFASSRNLSNLTLIVDRNGFQTWNKVDDIVAVESLVEKFRAFGWDADEVNGHDFERLGSVIERTGDRPHAIIARTVKGKGVSFMEGDGVWHSKSMSDEHYHRAMKEVQS
ncbi:MAG: transketolase [Candidatus Brennerbacteria bacterium]|nr:transketolase [Candidatus Brennerbacteria bacterium]